MGVTAAEDAAAFELLVTTYVQHQRLAATLRAESLTYTTVNAQGGEMIRARPEVALLADVDRRLLVLLGRFGLTPADRSKVVSHPGNASADPDDEFAAN